MIDWKNRSELTAINMINAVLGVFLFVSPWIVGFADAQAPSWNAWICGLAILVFAGAAIANLKQWEEWVNGALGLWTLIAPWVLGFASIAGAMWTHVGVGLAVAILAAVELWLIHNGPATKAA